MTEQAHPEWDASYTASTVGPVGHRQAAANFVRLADEGRLTGRLLDAGCGTGENALLATSSSAQVTGIDVAPTAIAQARAKASEHGLTARFEVADALDLGRLSLTVDTVIDSGVFHVFGDDDRARYVTSLAAVLRPAGACYLMCFSDRQPGTWGPRRVRADELRGVQGRLGRRVDYRRHLRDPPDGRHDTGPGLAGRDQAQLINRPPHGPGYRHANQLWGAHIGIVP